MGAAAATMLNNTGKLTALAATGISGTQLDAINHKHLPALLANATLGSGRVVARDVLWQVNRQHTAGFVMELSNP